MWAAHIPQTTHNTRHVGGTFGPTFQSASNTCRTIHHIEVYGTFDARHCKGFKNHCKRTVCCCCKSVALWSWQLAKGFKVGKSDSKDFSDREGCGCSLSSGIQQGLMVPADSWGTLLVFLSFTERVFCMLCCTCRIIKQEKAQITSFYATGRWKSLLWFINWEKAGILPCHTRRLFFLTKPVDCISAVLQS